MGPDVAISTQSEQHTEQCKDKGFQFNEEWEFQQGQQRSLHSEKKRRNLQKQWVMLICTGVNKRGKEDNK